ncbi:alpha-glucosidase [Hamadaea flava]|uniref:Glycoside hydrolase family 13 protein n=1 Tax=Hamadaea flava TaxID=1742688 RepID=A0ABV8LIK8_9ACTN|nr:glycoside hydrolase family 13 protein [Hamadaea flava]MCP2325510.1 alpha-glucosidase [Hamadaea flava]
MRLIDQPHHDGSPLYVSTARPALGETVTLRVRVPAASRVREVWLRGTPDGEPRFLPVRHHEGEWWVIHYEVRNPVTNYRFYFLREEGEPVWLTAAGIVAGDLTDATDFRLVAYDAPAEWMTDAIVYQIFPDRYARSTSAGTLDKDDLPDWALPREWDLDEVIGRGPGTAEQFFGGDLDGVVEHLDHIQALGVNTVYLTPIFPARSNHRYDASTFDVVDPLLGGDDALRRLAEAVHARGMRLIGDITTNHCGDAHEWFRAAAEDPNSPEREMFYFGPDYGLADGDYESWNGVKSLPKLNWGSTLTRERMIGVLRKWLHAPDGSPLLDGWRVDVANMTGRRADENRTHEVAALLRREIVAVRPDAMLVAEHMHDSTGDVDRDGWQGTMNYGGFTRPIWTWLCEPDTPNDYFFGTPGGVPRRTAESVLDTVHSFGGRMSWRTLVHSWNPLDSHDSARMRTVAGTRERHLVAVALQMTMPGTPMVFAGDEFGLTGWNGENSRTPMPWNRASDQDQETLSAYKSLVRLRTEQPALRRGGLRWVYAAADTLAFLRESPEETLLVVARRAAGEALDLGVGGAGEALGRAARSAVSVNLYGGADLVAGVVPAATGPDVQVWRLA